jgi:hypothetical protein
LVVVVVAQAVGVDPIVPGLGGVGVGARLKVIAVGAVGTLDSRGKAVSILIVVVVAQTVGVDAVVPDFLGSGVDVAIGIVAIHKGRITASISREAVSIIVELGEPVVDVSLADPVASGKKKEGREKDFHERLRGR